MLICQSWSRWEWDSGLPNNRSDSRPKKEKTQETVDRGALCRGNICTNAQCTCIFIVSVQIGIKHCFAGYWTQIWRICRWGKWILWPTGKWCYVLLWLWPMSFNVCSTLPPMVALELLQHIYFPALCQHHFKKTWSGTFPPRFFFHIKPVGYFTLG